MSNESLTQSLKQLKSSANILIIVGDTSSTDALAAGLALRRFLIKFEKQTTVLSNTPIPAKFQFLSDVSDIKLSSSLRKNMVIDISLLNTQIGELRYQKFEDKLSVFLTAKDGEFTEQDVLIRSAVYPFDLVVTLGVANLTGLGELYTKHAQLFFETPVLNIDFKPSNENYGRINFVELIASSCSEIVYDLLNSFDKNLIDENTATLLLAGLIGQTNSFQNIKTSPQVFLKASELINLGAKQQDIISSLYRSKSLGLLRLWGRVLARVKDDAKTQMVYSVVTAQDVEKSEASREDLDQIIFEMMQQLPFAKTFIFLAENSASETLVFAATTTPLDLTQLFAQFSPKSAGQAIQFTVARPLITASEEIVASVHAQLSKFNA